MKIYRGKIKRHKMRRRIQACGLILSLLFCAVGVRLCFLALDRNTAVAAEQSTRATLTLYTERRTIYDRKFLPLSEGDAEYAVCVSPTAQSYTTLSAYLGGESLSAARSKLRENKPFLIQSDTPMTGAGLTAIRHNARYGIADHIIGYLGGDGHGISGIERDFDVLLYTGQTAQAHYTADAAGGILAGISPEITLPDVGTDGVVLTLDREIQLVCEAAMDSIKSGAAVVTEVSSGDIVAMVSRPDFDAGNISAYLDDPASPLLNRAITNYNIGSVFKPLFAAAALELGVPESFTVNCTGSVEIDGHTFACHEKNGHGAVDFETAVAKSCNVFFYTLSREVDCTAVLALMEQMGVTAPDALSDSIRSPAAVLPRAQDLSAPAASANFSIGQGDLMLSPLKLAALYGMLARGGEYIPPRLVAGVFDGGYTAYPHSESTQVISKETCAKIRAYLTATLTYGTGIAAAPENSTAAGKTATAETGWLRDGQRVDQAWFAGYFPAEDPKYVVVVLCEDGVSGAYDCAPVFKEIADGMAAHGK